MKVVILLGSESDQEFVKGFPSEFKSYGIESEIIVASAHKVPEKVFEIVSENNKEEDIVYITVAGRSNGLSGVTAANSVHPVIACPPFATKEDFIININSTLVMPSDTPVMTVLDRQNVIMAVLRIFALKDKKLKKEISDRIKKIKKSFDK
ncbi:AIR carboxylase family protein [Candidatus Gracilibacteria bacterium]|jgi:5-(carboxyamino)imidazole ribonucleotide mutase|nr:AIR carboxylase family protein [Candidatus Gracilibacteria bacterium]